MSVTKEQTLKILRSRKPSTLLRKSLEVMHQFEDGNHREIDTSGLNTAPFGVDLSGAKLTPAENRGLNFLTCAASGDIPAALEHFGYTNTGLRKRKLPIPMDLIEFNKFIKRAIDRIEGVVE